MNQPCGQSEVRTFYDVIDPELHCTKARLGRYACEAKAREAGKKAGVGAVDLEPRAVTCVVLKGSAFVVRFRGERGPDYYPFGGRFAPEEWEDYERGYIEPCVTIGGVVYVVDVMNQMPPNMECICPRG